MQTPLQQYFAAVSVLPCFNQEGLENSTLSDVGTTFKKACGNHTRLNFLVKLLQIYYNLKGKFGNLKSYG